VIARPAVFSGIDTDKPPRFRFQDGQLRQQAPGIVSGSGTESMHGLTHEGQFE